jgi:hypothetical protein
MAILDPQSSILILDRFSQSRRARKSPIDNDDLAGHEPVMQNQAQHAVRNIVLRAAAFERRIFGSPFHQAFVVLRQSSFHPVTFDPPGRDSVDTNLRAESIGEGLGQIGDRGFARGVGQRLRAGTQSSDAARVDYASVRGFF